MNGEILKPVDLVYASHGCVRIDRAFLDTQTLTFYTINTCSSTRSFGRYQVKELAPDGTVLNSKGTYWVGDTDMAAGEKREMTVETSNDPRVTKIIVTVDSGRGAY